MIEHRIKIRNNREKNEFLKACQNLPCNVDVRKGGGMINAKSELAMMVLDCSLGDAHIRIHSDDTEYLKDFHKWLI